MVDSPLHIDAELAALRQRAYGLDPDIDDDPIALARLDELEALHVAEVARRIHVDFDIVDDAEVDPIDDDMRAEPPSPPATVTVDAPEGTPVSTRRRWLTTTRSGRVRLGLALSVVVVAVAYGVSWLVIPHPDATLREAKHEASSQILSLLRFASEAQIETSTLRGHEQYRGLEPWVGTNADGSRCLLIIEPASNNLQDGNCAPPGQDTIAYVGDWPVWGDPWGEGIPDGSVVRFALHGDVVEADLYPAAGAEG